jgi:hypothetical protein
MIRIILLGLLVAICVWCVFLYRRGGWRSVGCFVLTATVVGGVAWYALIPVDKGVSMVKIVSLMGGPLTAGVVSGIPALSWFVVSLVHPRGTRGGHVYAVVYALLMGLCFVPAGIIAAACYFPAVARKVLARVADALPGRADGSS